MGGNTALRDTAVLLPQLVDLAKSGKYTSTQDVAAACKVYEDEMIPRAFTWVAKSGYDQIMVSLPDCGSHSDRHANSYRTALRL